MKKFVVLLFLALLIGLPAIAQDFGTVSGRVTTENGEPAANANVIMFDNERNMFQTQTNRIGAFGFDRIPPGNYHIIATLDRLRPAEADIEVFANEETVIDLVLGGGGGGGDREFGSVSGMVTTADGEPAANAHVVLMGGRREMFQAQTDENGAFAFDPVPVGNYHITAMLDRMQMAEADIEVFANEETIIDLVLGEGGGDGGGGDHQFGSVSGTVTTNEGPAENVTVNLWHEGRGRPVLFRSTITDGEGAFLMERVPAGEFHITAALEDVGVAEADIQVVVGEETVIDLVLGQGEIGEEYGVEEQDINNPFSITLLRSYPNPFNSVATVDYNLPAASRVRLSVFNTAGQLIQKLSDGWQTAGEYQTAFNGQSLPAGSYILRLEAVGQIQMQRLLLLK